MSEVPLTRTPLERHAAAGELVRALRGHGEAPDREEAALLLALVWTETARGEACNNNNPGNITASTRAGDFFRPPWFRVDATSSARNQELHRKMERGQAPSAFRAYPDSVAGFHDFAGELVHTFPVLVKAARSGDAGSVARALVVSGYSPDAQPGTDRTLAAFAKEFLREGLFSDLPLDRGPRLPLGSAFFSH